jgi:hypothetical protein
VTVAVPGVVAVTVGVPGMPGAPGMTATDQVSDVGLPAGPCAVTWNRYASVGSRPVNTHGATVTLAAQPDAEAGTVPAMTSTV